MAVRSHQGSYISRGVHKSVWSGLLNGDTGDLVDAAIFPVKTIQIEGTFGVGGSITIQGTNDGTNFRPLTDPQGNVLTFTVAGLERVGETPLSLRPNVTAGDGTTNLTVTLISQGDD